VRSGISSLIFAAGHHCLDNIASSKTGNTAVFLGACSLKTVFIYPAHLAAAMACCANYTKCIKDVILYCVGKINTSKV